MRPALVAAAVTLILAPLVARAEGACTSGDQPSLGIVQVTAGSALTTFYVDDRNYVTGNGTWTYAESNGLWTEKLPGVYLGYPQHADLQRGSSCGPVPNNCEICYDPTPDGYGPDQLLFF